RIAACQTLYSRVFVEINPIGEDLIVKNLKLSEKGTEFYNQLLNATLDNLYRVDQTIQKHLLKWKQSRISDSLNAILRIGCCELLYFKETDAKVVFNESIEICREFAGEDAVKILNGVLHAVWKTISVKDS
ncbi:MAG: hypothetical protein OEY59_07800, partial [Deltaproteobacteria bacterium]|nr:hypothetical protein [Deltaproteobacteria bacterium]